MNYCLCCGATSASSSPAEAPRRRGPAPEHVAASSAAQPIEDPGRCKVLTVGHSTRPIEDLVALLHPHGVTQLVDVRTVPRSRHNPQFDEDAMPISLAAANIGYAHAGGLGGFRRTVPDSPNAGWRNLSFRGFADYMRTAEFAQNLVSVIELARRDRVALMCAEALPWRCHRSLIADALVVRDVATCESLMILPPTRPASDFQVT